MKKKLLTLAALLVASPLAEADTIGMHIATQHFGPNAHGLETLTPGIYWRNKRGLTIGAYRNSDRSPSAYLAWTWQTSDRRFALTAGVVTGYDIAPIVPLVVPSMRVPLTRDYAMRFAVIPKPIKHGGAYGLHLTLEREI